MSESVYILGGGRTESVWQPVAVLLLSISRRVIVQRLKAQYSRKMQGLQKQVEKLTAGLQKVSDELELRKSAPQVVDNDQVKAAVVVKVDRAVPNGTPQRDEGGLLDVKDLGGEAAFA